MPLALAAAATLFAAAACNGDSGETTGTAGGCGSPGVTPDAVKVGLVYPDSGPTAGAFSGFRSGVDARFGVENDKGGVNGRRLDYAWRDDTGDDAVNLIAAEDLVERENVFSVLELSTGTRGSAEYLHAGGVPTFGPGIETSWSTFDNMFSWHTFVSATSSATTWGEFVYGQGGRTAAVIGTSSDTVGQIAVEATARSMQAAGVEVAAKMYISASGFDAISVFRQVRASGADTVTGQIFLPQLLPLLQEARNAGVSFKVVLFPSSFYDSTVLQQFGPLLDGMFVHLDTMPFELNLPVHEEFLRAMATYAPQMQPRNASGAVNGWILADMFVEGARRAGDCPTRQNLIKNLRQYHDYTAGGLLPGTDFAKFRELGRCYSFVRVTPTAYTVLDPVNRCGTTIPLA